MKKKKNDDKMKKKQQRFICCCFVVLVLTISTLITTTSFSSTIKSTTTFVLSSSTSSERNATASTTTSVKINEEERTQQLFPGQPPPSSKSTGEMTAIASTMMRTTNDINQVQQQQQQQQQQHWNKTLANSESLLLDIKTLQKRDWKSQCGHYKCYYPSMHHQIGYGYVISQRRVSDRDASSSTLLSLAIAKRSYELGIEIQQRYYNKADNSTTANVQFRQFNVIPPIGMFCSKELADTLNNQLGLLDDYDNGKKKNHEPYRETSKQHERRDRLIIQIVQEFPQNSLLYHHSHYNKLDTFINTILSTATDDTDADADDTTSTTQTATTTRTTTAAALLLAGTDFIQTLQHEINVLIKVILVDYPQLFIDFQFLITNKGLIYHIDLDRCFQTQYAVVTVVASTTKKQGKATNNHHNAIIDVKNKNSMIKQQEQTMIELNEFITELIQRIRTRIEI